MRNLTQQEIYDAPKTSKFYDIDSSNSVHFYESKLSSSFRPVPKPSPRKEFDIDSHDWADESIVLIGADDDCIELMCDISGDVFDLSREDFIAGGKHFKLTESDLK